MIVRPRPHWLRLLVARRGSLLRRILSQQIFVLLLSCAVVMAHGILFHWKVSLTSAPFSLMGVALAIFLGFRINASYDRYWEARKLWGAVLIEARNLARQSMTLPASFEAARVRPFVLGLAAFATAMRNQLRGDAPERGMAGLLPEAVFAELRGARFMPALILLWLGQQLGELRRGGGIEPILAQHMEAGLDRLSESLGGCERIAGTPLPFTYTVILHRSCYVYCILLPFGLVDTIGWMTPMVVGFVSYTFFALEALSDELEDPFGLLPNDLALDAIVAGVESSMREMLGDPLAPVPQPDAHFILR